MTATPLETLLAAARAHCDGAARRLAEDLAHTRAAEDRLALLKRYRHDYEMALRSRAAIGLTVVAWHNYQRFMAQLDAAVKAQHEEIAARRHAADARRRAWSSARQRVRSFERLSERREEEMRLAGDRREQAALDEQAMRRHALRREP
jgi:flagellar FliJ protein